MQEKEVLEYLEDLAEKLGIEVIYGKLGEEDYPLKGGLCKVTRSSMENSGRKTTP
jgi:hypothetical protein